MLTDLELVTRVKVLDDRGSYTALVRKYQTPIRAFLYRRTRDREWADDLAQETFLQAYRSISQLTDSEKFRAWLFTVAHRQFLQANRSREPVVPVSSLDDESHSDVLFPQATSDLEARSELRSLLSSLRPVEQEAIILCLGHELSHSEAAEVLNLSLGTVKSLVTRAREKLRSQEVR